MKKKSKILINDLVCFGIFVLTIAFLLSVLVIMLVTDPKTINGFLDFIVCYGVFIIFLLMSLTGALVSFELIVISDNSIVSQKIWKRKKILYSDIKSIRIVEKNNVGPGGVESTWEIATSDVRIYVIRSIMDKRRDKIVNKIKKELNL